MIITQIEIDDKLWEKISKFSKIIKWGPNKFAEFILDKEIDFYCQAIDPEYDDISQRIWNEFLEKPFLKKLKTVLESET